MMLSVLLKDGLSTARANARLRIESLVDLPRLFRVIDADPALVGAGVVYIDHDFNVVALRDFLPICSIAVKRVILREPPRYMAPLEYARQLETSPRESRLVAEALGVVLSCTGAVIAWSLVGTASALSPFTGGASTVVAVIGASSALAATAQCGNALIRTGAEWGQPEFNDMLDSNDWYQAVTLALDGISLLGAATTALTTVRMIGIAKAATGKSTMQVLKGLNRQERLKLTRELLRVRDPWLASRLLKLRQLTGELPKRYSATQLNEATRMQIRDCIGAGLAVAGSAQSGNLHVLAIGIYSEIVDE